MRVIRSESFLRNYFNIFNKKYFNNVLRKVDLEWNDTHKSFFSYQASVEHKKIVPVKISISYTDDFNKFRNSLVHEMLHYYVNCCIMEFSLSDWISFVNICKNQNYDKAIEVMLGSKHNSTWLYIARELNSEHKELSIKPFISETSNVEDLHLIKTVEFQDKNSRGKVNYICLPTDRFNKLKSRFNGNQVDFPRTDFFEFEINKDNIDMSCISETKGSSLLRKEFIKFLEESETINNNKIKYLGSMKHENL